MAELTFNRFNSFSEALAEKVHDMGSDVFQARLSNSAPLISYTQASQITEIANGNGYTTGGITITITSSTQTNGVYTCVLGSNAAWTASGGNIAPFQWVYLVNSTATNEEVIGYWDIGSTQNITDGGVYTATFSGQTILTINPPA